MATLAVLAATSSSSKSGGGSYAFLILIGIFAIAYFLLIRPARNRQRAAMSQRGRCEVGDEVTTTAGLIATVVAIDEATGIVTLEVAPGVHSRYLPASIVKVNYPEESGDDASAPSAAGEHEAIHDDDPAKPVAIDPTERATDPDSDEPHPTA